MLAHGGTVTTRQIADTCGVAEGTLFRVFETKEDLVTAVIDDILDPESVVASLRSIDPHATLADAVRRIVEIIGDEGRQIRALMMAMHLRAGQGTGGPPEPDPTSHQKLMRRHAAVASTLTEVVGRYGPHLRVSAHVAGAFIQATTVATSMPGMPEELRTPETLAGLLYHAISEEPHVQ